MDNQKLITNISDYRVKTRIARWLKHELLYLRVVLNQNAVFSFAKPIKTSR